MRTSEMPPSPCPNCGKKLDRATDAKGGTATPKEGDISVCNGCFAVSTFDANLQLQPASLEALDIEEKDKAYIRKMQAFFRARQPN